MKNLPLLVILSALAVFCIVGASCVMPGDIHALQDNFEDFQEGVVTKPEFDTRNAEIVAEMEARNQRLKEEGSRLPTDPVQLLAWGASMAATVFGTNKLRDARRRAGTDVKPG